MFLCPIPNPLTSKILEKLNLINSSGRVTNVLLVKVIYTVGVVVIVASMVGFRLTADNFQRNIV